MCNGQCGVMQSTAVHAGRVHLLQNACHSNVVTASSMHQAPKFVEHEPHWADFGVVYITNYQPIMHPPPQPTNWKSLLLEDSCPRQQTYTVVWNWASVFCLCLKCQLYHTFFSLQPGIGTIIMSAEQHSSSAVLTCMAPAMSQGCEATISTLLSATPSCFTA
jgi:hypothetical protein